MAADSFRQFCTDVGIPMNLNTDMAISFDGHPIVYQDVVRNNHINHSHAAARHQLKHIDIATGHIWQPKWLAIYSQRYGASASSITPT